MTAAYPAHLQDEVEEYLSELEFASEPATAGLNEGIQVVYQPQLVFLLLY